ncbi:ERF family protein [Mycobacteroides abscessus]|nr:ERF family protein [Mycobacteroides abscessus]MDM2387289.1 ERF family protein [Mycobacteroides abscessus]
MTTIYQALSEVMKDVGAVRKGERNQQQGFSFRGIDAVTSAVYPALTKHGVIVVPKVLEYEYGTVEVGRNRTLMGHVRLTVEFTWYGPDGDSITSVAAAESMDAGDKATAKAHSVAFRTAMLQTLCLPTDEPDPDSQVYERSSAPPERTDVDDALDELAAACTENGWDQRETAGKFFSEHGKPPRQCTADVIRKFIGDLINSHPAERAEAASA